MIPAEIMPTEYIALIVACILMLISKLDAKKIFEKIDIELILYLIGIFVLVGGLEYINLMKVFGEFLGKISQGDSYMTFITLLWASAYLSANLDNIPITRALLPVVPVMTEGMTTSESKIAYYGLTIGANWGDNLTPLGDNVLVMKLAEQNKGPISTKEFFKLGFITSNYQLFIVTIIFSFRLRPSIGLILLVVFLSLIGIIIIIQNRKKRKLENKI